jgi:hypothetical protein
MMAAMIVRRSGREPAPLSAAQSRAWILQQMDPGRAPFNRPLAVRLKGPLDCAALSRSVSEILRRHEILRTIFPERNGKPVQMVCRPRRSTSASRSGSAPRRARKRSEASSAAAQCAFDLERGPLVRSALLRLAPGNHVLLLMMHHIVFDGWSEGILLEELGVLYAAYSQGRPSPLPEPPLQYGDFAVWQQRSSEDVLERHLAYWRRQLHDIPSALALPTDFPRANASTSRGERRSFTLRAPLTDQLTALARENASRSSWRCSRRSRSCSGVTRHRKISRRRAYGSRTHAETEGLIGCFVNVVVLRADLSAIRRFEHCSGVRETAFTAYAHQEVPSKGWSRRCGPEGPESWPLFQVMSNMHVLPKAETAGPGAVDRALPVRFRVHRRAGPELSCRPLANGLACTFAYAADLYLPDTVDRMAANFQTLLAAAVEP